MPKHDLFPVLSSPSSISTLAPPDVIIRGGQDVVTTYAKLHTIFANAQNDQFAVGVSDFLEWLEDLAPGMSLEHIVEDNISSHLTNLASVGCSDAEQASRLCAIDLFLTNTSDSIPELGRIPRSSYGGLCPPLLIVENSSENADYVSVYIDFLMSHTNRKTREVYAQGLRRFCDWIVDHKTNSRLPLLSELTGSQRKANVLPVKSSQKCVKTGLLPMLFLTSH